MRALAGGGTQRVFRDGSTVLSHVSWDVAGNCQSPRRVEYLSRPEGNKIVVGKGLPKPWVIDMTVPCRTGCENCLKRRAAHWRLRSLTEWRDAPRTWLWTLTLNPANHMQALNRVRLRLQKGGTDFDALPADQQLLERHRETGAMVTLALKRLRKGDKSQEVEPASFRYICVLEAHASGLPHYHLMIHETGAQISHRNLTRAWKQGFQNAKLIHDAPGAQYAAKYLSKSALARVRASYRYGYDKRPQGIESCSDREKISHSEGGIR